MMIGQPTKKEEETMAVRTMHASEEQTDVLVYHTGYLSGHRTQEELKEELRSWGEEPYTCVLTRDELEFLAKYYAKECFSTDEMTEVYLKRGSNLSRQKRFYGSRLAHFDDLLGEEKAREMLEDLYREVDFAARRASQEARIARHDRVRRFLEERCVRDHTERTFEPRLLEAFREWCRENNEKSMSRKKFRSSVQHNNIGRGKDAEGQQYFGIKLTDNQSTEDRSGDPS
jgi:hypothetical protein